jgi:probable F420-dependent oxidoreductase
VSKLRFGLMYGTRFGYAPPPDIFARRIEELGFDGLWVAESPTNRDPQLDGFTMLCFAAAATSRITVGTSVMLLPLHNPTEVARQWAALDNLSGGRAILGVGVGGEFPKQFEAYGIPKTERAKRTNEGIEVIKSLWTQETSTYQGEIFNFEGITVQPKPIQKPHPPIWIGGRPGGVEYDLQGNPHFKSKTASLVRATKHGDAWCPNYMTVDMYRNSVRDIKELAKTIGRDISKMVWAYNVPMWLRDTYDNALNDASGLRYGRDLSKKVMSYDLIGGPKDIVRRITEYAEAGVEYFVMHNNAPQGQEDRTLETFAKEVMPLVR